MSIIPGTVVFVPLKRPANTRGNAVVGGVASDAPPQLCRAAMANENPTPMPALLMRS